MNLLSSQAREPLATQSGAGAWPGGRAAPPPRPTALPQPPGDRELSGPAPRGPRSGHSANHCSSVFTGTRSTPHLTSTRKVPGHSSHWFSGEAKTGYHLCLLPSGGWKSKILTLTLGFLITKSSHGHSAGQRMPWTNACWGALPTSSASCLDLRRDVRGCRSHPGARKMLEMHSCLCWAASQ